MSELFTTVVIFISFLGIFTHYTQAGLGGMSAPLRQFGMFLLEKAAGPATDMFQKRKGDGARTWIQTGMFWLTLAAVGGFIGAWHKYDPTALDSLSNIGWGWDDGSAMAHFTNVSMNTAIFSILLGGAFVAHSRATRSPLASESSASMMAMVWTLQTLFGLFLPLLGSWFDFEVGALEMALYGLISGFLVLGLLVNSMITLGNREDAPISVSSWFLILSLATLFFSRIAEAFGELLGCTTTVWIADIMGSSWVILGLIFAVGYHIIPHATGQPIWSGSLTKASMFLLYLSAPPFFLSEAGHADNFTISLGAIMVTIGMLPVLAGSFNMTATTRGNTGAIVSNPGAMAVAAGAMLLPLFAIFAFFTGLNVMVGDGGMSDISDTVNHYFLYLVGGLFAMGVLYHSYPLATGKTLEGPAGLSVYIVVLGGIISFASAIMGDWTMSALTDAEIDDPSSGVSGFTLTSAFAFYGITVGFLMAVNCSLKTLLQGKVSTSAGASSSDISSYTLVEGTTSVRDLLGRGVGLDTILIIGQSDEDGTSGSTVIEVSAGLHNDEVDEFPSNFDEDLVELTKWLCGRGTTTAQFFNWADVDKSGEIDMFEFSNALRVADIADLPPWDISKLVETMDINGDGRINLPELDIALLNIRNTLGIEFIPFEEDEEEVAEEEVAEEEVAEEEASTEAKPSKSELSKMKKAELVEVAESMGLETKGTKSDLIERITQA